MQKKQWYGLFVDSFYNKEGGFIFLFMLLAMFANISVEALKWKYLVRNNDISFSTSLIAVFSGISAGLITPHGIGDYIGRILFLNPDKRLENIGSVLFSRVAQLCITCITGVVATIYFCLFIEFDNKVLVALILAFCSLLVIYGLWLFRTFLLDTMKRIPVIKNIAVWFEQLRLYSNRVFVVTLLFSAMRYFIFLSQFVCLLLFFKVELPLMLLVIGAVFTFFIKSIVPTFFDLGVRELAAIFFFSRYAIDDTHVLSASIGLWVFNLLIPAIIGLFCMLNVNYTKQS